MMNSERFQNNERDALRLSDTNSASDSGGRTWGLDGNLFWIVVGGGFMFVAILLLLFSTFRCGFLASLGIAAIPLTMTFTYVFGFRQGKPPAYDIDLLDGWLNGKGFQPNPNVQPQHPLKKQHPLPTIS